MKTFNPSVAVAALAVTIAIVSVSWVVREKRVADTWRSQHNELERRVTDERIAQAQASRSSESRCGPLNVDPPSKSVRFEAPELGLSFLMPFNPEWGYDGIDAPYVTASGASAVLFGPPRKIDDCEWAHSYQVTFIEPRTIEEAQEFVNEAFDYMLKYDDVTEEEIAIRVTKKSGLTVWTYSLPVPGPCYAMNYEVVAPNSHYVFSGCGGRLFSEIDDLLSTVEIEGVTGESANRS